VCDATGFDCVSETFNNGEGSVFDPTAGREREHVCNNCRRDARASRHGVHAGGTPAEPEREREHVCDILQEGFKGFGVHACKYVTHVLFPHVI